MIKIIALMKPDVKATRFPKLSGQIIFIWDFHGVLEKDNEYAVQHISRRVLKEFGYPSKVPLRVVRDLYGQKWIEYFIFLSGEKNLKKLTQMVDRAREISKLTVHRFIKPMDNAARVLGEIIRRGHRNVVISNSRQDRILDFLRIVSLDKYMKEVVGVDGHANLKFDTAKEKAEVIRRVCGKRKYARKVIIGDNESDIRAGHLAGAETCFFVNRFNAERAKKTKADLVVKDLRSVLKFIS